MSAAGENPAHRPSVSVLDGLVQHYDANGLGFGKADLLCCGSAESDERVGLLVREFSRHSKDSSPVPQLTIVLPPGEEGTTEEDRLRGAIESALREDISGPNEPQRHAITSDRVQFVRSPDRWTSSLISMLRAVGPGTIVLVTDTAGYRAEGVATGAIPQPGAATLEEDYWAPQLQALATDVVRAVEGRAVFVVLDAGRLTPYRPALQEFLLSVKGCGFVGAVVENDPDAVLAARLDRWGALLADGRLGAVLKDIEGLPASMDADKALLRVQMMHRAGFVPQALAEIENEFQITRHVSSHALVRLARIAQQGGSSSLAAKLLGPAVDKLDSLEELELAMNTADEINDQGLTHRAAGRLGTIFPNSPGLRLRKIAACLSASDYEGAASAAAGVPDFTEAAQLYALLADSLRGDGAPDYDSALKRVSRTMPGQTSQALLLCVRDAVGRKLLWHALVLATATNMTGQTGKRTAGLLLDITESLVLEGKADAGASVMDDVKPAIVKVVEYLSHNPQDGGTRVRLAHVLSLGMSGLSGLALVAAISIDLMREGVSIDERQRPTGYSVEELHERLPRLEGAFKWLADESPLVLGKSALPPEFVAEPPDKLLPAISDLLYVLGNKLDDELDVKAMLTWLAFGLAVAPHSTDRDQDIEMLRLVAGMLISAGRVQHARDLVEQALQQAGSIPRRRRLAWLAMADAYHRLGNYPEGLVCLACGFGAGGELSSEEALHEATTAARFLRDVGLRDAARQVLAGARELVRHRGLNKQYELRLQTSEIQLDMMDLLSAERYPSDALLRLMRKAASNAQAVLLTGDNPGPAAVVLGQLSRTAGELGLDLEPEASETLKALLKRMGPREAALVNMVSSPHPTAEDVLTLVKDLETARYSEDIGYDVRNVVLVARRLLGSEEAGRDPVIAAFALELLADRATAMPGWEATSSPPPAPATIEEPGVLAREVSSQGLNLVMLGLAEDLRLVRIVASKGELCGVVREDKAVFSSERLKSWAKEFPYRYGVDTSTFNLFYTSTEELGLSGLPEGRTLVVMDTQLQQFPVNLLRVGDEFAGSSRPMAAAPSLCWLAAARRRIPLSERRLVAWIPTRATKTGTLAMIADRLGPTFEKYGFDFDRTPTASEKLCGSELAAITAHGGVMPGERYFQLVADDDRLRVSAAELAWMVRNTGVVVLFVCSGGRADKHPWSNTIVGLAKQLLDRGCSAVVAPAWPLDARVAYHWLPEFLDAYSHGACLIDANFTANKAVARGLGGGPELALAMSVYGDALRALRS